MNAEGDSTETTLLDLKPFKRLGPIVAWVVAILVGGGVALRSDLLDAVLRGALAWVGALVLWSIGFVVCERIVTVPTEPPTAPVREETAEGRK